MGAGHPQTARRHDAASGSVPASVYEGVNALATYLEDSLDKAGAANPNPGSVRIHRLNRAEYANAMRDMFGIDVDAAALLPTDDISDGFDNIASALKVSPSFLDQYIMAARAVVKQAVGTPLTGKEVKTTLRGMDASVPLPPGARGGITAQFLAPYEGDYEFRATGNPAVFTVDGANVDAQGRTHLKAGLHTIVAANAAHSFVESEGELFGFVPGAAGTGYASTGIGGSAAGGGGRRTRSWPASQHHRRRSVQSHRQSRRHPQPHAHLRLPRSRSEGGTGMRLAHPVELGAGKLSAAP